MGTETYSESIDRFVHSAKQLWSFPDSTSICIDEGEALVVRPRGDALVLSLWSYSWTQHHITDYGIDKLPIICHADGRIVFKQEEHLHPVDLELRLTTVNRAANMITQLCQSRNQSIAA